jgi:hypothetical protein
MSLVSSSLLAATLFYYKADLSTQFSETLILPPRNQLNRPAAKSQSIPVWKSCRHFSRDLDSSIDIDNINTGPLYAVSVHSWATKLGS